MGDDEFRYILVTPAKNEELCLPMKIRSVAGQLIRPVLWAIVDDGSDDGTEAILAEASRDHEWIKIVRLESDVRYDMEEHYASVCRSGFDFACSYCKKAGIGFDYVALSDADTVYEAGYYRDMMRFLAGNEEYGIVSGRLLVSNNGEVYAESRFVPGAGDFPFGTGRVWKKEAFDQTGGFLSVKAPDAVSNVMARLKGWKIRQLTDVVFYELRDTGSKAGLWTGYRSKGRRDYYLGYNFLGTINTVIDYLVLSRYRDALIKSMAYLQGYYSSALKREKKIGIPEVRKYNGTYGRVLNNYVSFVKYLVFPSIRRPPRTQDNAATTVKALMYFYDYPGSGAPPAAGHDGQASVVPYDMEKVQSIPGTYMSSICELE
jgi:glycosyltransferase involved in cell wall biosynthesis